MDKEESIMYGDQYLAVIRQAAIILLLIYILCIVARWLIFIKAGEPGWKSIIPFYSVYVQYELTWQGYMGIIWCVLFVASQVLSGIIGSIISITAFVIQCIAMNKLAKSFGRGTGFTVGLIFLTPIFLMILGFGKSQYWGNTSG